MGSNLKRWARLADEAPVPPKNDSPAARLLDRFANLAARLVGDPESSKVSPKVMRQLMASERAYKGWVTRQQTTGEATDET